MEKCFNKKNVLKVSPPNNDEDLEEAKVNGSLSVWCCWSRRPCFFTKSNKNSPEWLDCGCSNQTETHVALSRSRHLGQQQVTCWLRQVRHIVGIAGAAENHVVLAKNSKTSQKQEEVNCSQLQEPKDGDVWRLSLISLCGNKKHRKSDGQSQE